MSGNHCSCTCFLLGLYKNIKSCWSFSRPHSWSVFLPYINDFPDDVICNIAICAHDTTLDSKCDQASYMWQQLELASGLESDLQDPGLGQEVACCLIVEKTQMVLFDRSNNNDAIDVKIDRSVLGEKSSFKMLWSTFLSKSDWAFYITSIAKTASKKIESLIRSMKFISAEIALYCYKFAIWLCMKYIGIVG